MLQRQFYSLISAAATVLCIPETFQYVSLCRCRFRRQFHHVQELQTSWRSANFTINIIAPYHNWLEVILYMSRRHDGDTDQTWPIKEKRHWDWVQFTRRELGQIQWTLRASRIISPGMTRWWSWHWCCDGCTRCKISSDRHGEFACRLFLISLTFFLECVLLCSLQFGVVVLEPACLMIFCTVCNHRRFSAMTIIESFQVKWSWKLSKFTEFYQVLCEWTVPNPNVFSLWLVRFGQCLRRVLLTYTV